MIEATADPIVPLRLFAEEAAHRDMQATEALFLTYNVDLPFLEARLLDLCRQAGARVTVVADATVWAPDLRSVTRAGLRYHLGLVCARAAFHPKLSVIVGPERAIAIVGSGNLGMAGWQSNAEIATVISATKDAAPIAMEDLRGVLDTLANRSELDPSSADAIRRTSAELTALLAQAEIIDTGHRVAASWDGPLADRLPSSPVDELLLSAAFHDKASATVADLLRRLRPSSVRVALQPGRTVIDPAALDRVLTEYASESDADCAVLIDQEPRYRHGKLIEWTVDGARSALTGSPNLSSGALLLDVPKGNFELAVLGPTSTLFPPGNPASNPASLPARSGFLPGETPGESGPLVVAATVRRDVLSLRVARATTNFDVESSNYSDPDAWLTLRSETAAVSTLELTGEFNGGDRVRLAWNDSSGSRRRSAPMYVTDLELALSRPVDRSHEPRIKQAALTDLWGDDLSFLESLLHELQSLTGPLTESMPSSPELTHVIRPDTGRTAPKSDTDVWLWLREDVVATLGPGIGPFALGFPPLPFASTAPSPDWTDVADLTEEADLETEVDPGDSETEENDDPHGSDEPNEFSVDHNKSPLGVRRKKRRWCQDIADIAPRLDVPYRLLALRITLRFWRRGDWDEDDPSPLRIIDTLVTSLAAPNPRGRLDPPAELTARVGSLVTVALTLLQPDDGGADEVRSDIYRSLRAVLASLSSTASDEQLEADFKNLVKQADMEYYMYTAHRLREDAISGDRLGELERRLRLENTPSSVTRPAINLLHLVADVPTVRVERLALELICEVEEHSGIGIWVSNREGDWALAAWSARDLIRVTPYPNGRLRWRYHHLRQLTTPCSIAGEEFRGQNVNLGRSRPEPEAAAILQAMGITDPYPPTSTGRTDAAAAD